VRFYLDKPVHRKAYEFLSNQSQSRSQLIVLAIAVYSENQERDNKLVGKFVSEVEKILAGVTAVSPAPIVSEVQKTDEILSAEIDYDFLGG
jgi:hypothetical protein